jgi:hypothetical protein
MLGRHRPGDETLGQAAVHPRSPPGHNRALGNAVHQWAFSSLTRSTWARDLYDLQITKGKSHHPALGHLATGGWKLLWHCLHRGVHYSEAIHPANRSRAVNQAA